MIINVQVQNVIGLTQSFTFYQEKKLLKVAEKYSKTFRARIPLESTSVSAAIKIVR